MQAQPSANGASVKGIQKKSKTRGFSAETVQFVGDNAMFITQKGCGFISRWKLAKKPPTQANNEKSVVPARTMLAQPELSPKSVPTPNSAGTNVSSCSSVNSSPYASPRVQEFPVFAKSLQPLEGSTPVLPSIKNLIDFAKAKQM